MKKFITKEALPDILADLAEKFLVNCDKVAIDISLVKYSTGQPCLQIKALRTGTWETIAENQYEMIDKVHDSYDVIGEAIEEPFIKTN